MLDPALDVQLRSEGLLPAPKPFTMLSFQPTLPSIECPWGVEGDYHSFVYYTWTQLAPGERDTFLVKAGQSGMSAERVDGGTWLAWGSDAPEGTVGIMLTDEWAVGALTPADVANVVWTR